MRLLRFKFHTTTETKKRLFAKCTALKFLRVEIVKATELCAYHEKNVTLTLWFTKCIRKRFTLSFRRNRNECIGQTSTVHELHTHIVLESAAWEKLNINHSLLGFFVGHINSTVLITWRQRENIVLCIRWTFYICWICLKHSTSAGNRYIHTLAYTQVHLKRMYFSLLKYYLNVQQ